MERPYGAHAHMWTSLPGVTEGGRSHLPPTEQPRPPSLLVEGVRMASKKRGAPLECRINYLGGAFVVYGVLPHFPCVHAAGGFLSPSGRARVAPKEETRSKRTALIEPPGGQGGRSIVRRASPLGLT